MRKDLRPYWVKKLYLQFRRWYTDYFLRPQCEYLGPYDAVHKPWYVHISGPNIRIGKCLTAIGEPMKNVLDKTKQVPAPDGFIAKPIELSDLASLVKQIVN